MLIMTCRFPKLVTSAKWDIIVNLYQPIPERPCKSRVLRELSKDPSGVNRVTLVKMVRFARLVRSSPNRAHLGMNAQEQPNMLMILLANRENITGIGRDRYGVSEIDFLPHIYLHLVPKSILRIRIRCVIVINIKQN